MRSLDRYALTTMSCLLALALAANASIVGVEPPVMVNSTGGESATMAIPRWKGYLDPTHPERFWIVHSSFSSSATNIVFTDDSGDTWHDTGMQAFENGYLDFHASVFGRGSDFYISGPWGDAILASRWAAPAESNDDRRVLVTIPNTTGGHRSNTMVDGNGRWWIFTRLAGSPAQNVRYTYSDNQGGSWTSGVAFSTGVDDVRIGSMPYADGRALLFVLYLQSDRGYEYYKWSGTRFVALADHSIWPEYIGWERRFTHTIVGDAIHLIFRDGDRLRHVWKHHNNGQGTWNTNIVPTTPSAEIDPVAAVRDGELYLFYSLRTNDSNAASAVIRVIVWNQVTATWGQELAVSDGSTTHNVLPNTCFNVPATADYVPVVWNAGSDGSQIIFSKLLIGTTGTPVGEDAPAHPQLLANYPNPFNPRTVIPCVLPRAGAVRLTVHDLAGRLVAVLADGDLPAGRHEFTWSGAAQDGSEMPSGVYHVRLHAGADTSSRRITLVR
ncbi:MAG TPA: FlgD immunoglobulin-like domain containing protein [Candidatus Krumholzibacteria bacterium]|nr:FlgD immunoglobulin-like domain containing protein [Candidatus Krumholzibacteria bacterium]HPD72118.1 FlgD immunoglobulin-like domain containing protein [Candidatus Krumholzibacteria bacterium]HRY40950.1 FlgD immunoglobulin-like domain containing protein [Candidatus Krumholzibacteria bacterium]